MNAEFFTTKTRRREGLLVIGSTLSREVHQQVDRRKQQVQVSNVRKREPNNPFLRPEWPHEHRQEGEKNRHDRNHRIMPVNTLAFVVDTENRAGPIHRNDVNRREEEKSAQDCEHNAHAGQRMEAFA